jgi:hypothetical protein
MNENPQASVPRSRIILIIGAVVILAGSITAAVLLTRSPSARSSAPPKSGTSQVTSLVAAPNVTAPPSLPTEHRTTTAPDTSPPSGSSFAGQPLWPFAGPTDAAAWQSAFRTGGHQPWHLDASLTALSFTRTYLGYTNVDKAIAVRSSGPDAWVTVGFDNPTGQPVTSAVLHLARLDSGMDAPWEIIGTHDTTLTLATPVYGSAARSPMTTGGLITGVEESLSVQVRALAASAPLGHVGGVPAGGDHTPWRIQVPLTTLSGHGVLTVAVATGGHIATVERFAITGLRY